MYTKLRVLTNVCNQKPAKLTLWSVLLACPAQWSQPTVQQLTTDDKNRHRKKRSGPHDNIK